MAADIRLTRRGLLGGAGAVVGGALLGPVAGAPSTASAQAAPRVYTRAEWRARPPTSAATVLDRAPDHIVGHRDYSATACPGDVLYARLPELRDEVAGSLGVRRVEESSPVVPSGLPGPRHTFDHGPAAAPGEPTR